MRPRPVVALLGAAVCALVAVVVWALTFHTSGGLSADAAVVREGWALQTTPIGRLADPVAALCDLVPYAVFAGLLILWAWRRGGLRRALAVAGVVLIPNLVAQILKHLLAVPRPGEGVHIDAASWPSGHATAAMALALAAVLAAPPARRRLVAAAGALFATAVGSAVVVLNWHYPSDALGGFAIAGVVACLALAALDATAPLRRMGDGATPVEPGRRGQSPSWERPGVQSTSSVPLAPRDRMNSRSDSRLR